VTDALVVRVDVGAVAVLTLNRPSSRNALNRGLIRALYAALKEADADPDVLAVVLTGADPAFCAGIDLKHLGTSGVEADSIAAGGLVGEPFPIAAKPIIGAVNGATVTGGLELALACDFLVASERARFADTHARVGVMPGWGLSVRLPRVIGHARALEMSLAGTRLDAQTALAWGLVNHVVPHAELMDTALDIATRMAAPDPHAVTTLLRMYREAGELPESEALRHESAASQAWIAAMDRTGVPGPSELNARRA
jgi:enoyl-CoA hydratase